MQEDRAVRAPTPPVRFMHTTATSTHTQSQSINRNEQQLQAVKHLQRVYEGVLEFARDPQKYTRTSYRFVDFGIRKEVRGWMSVSVSASARMAWIRPDQASTPTSLTCVE